MFFGKKFSGHHKGFLSGLDILVLSMIKNNDVGISGYGLIQDINDKFKDLWRASAGTIYPLLSRLAHKNLVEIEEITENNRQKKVYRISDKGNDVLRKVLEENLLPSIDTLGDYIQTIIKAIPIPSVEEEIFSCFPFRRFPSFEKVDESDYSLGNIKHIEQILHRLERTKGKLEHRTHELDIRIGTLKSTLKKIREERDKNAKIIEIIDDDEEFENF